MPTRSYDALMGVYVTRIRARHANSVTTYSRLLLFLSIIH